MKMVEDDGGESVEKEEVKNSTEREREREKSQAS